MQQPRRRPIPPHAQRRNTRRPPVARVLAGLVVFLALGAGMWRSAAGAQCSRAAMGAVVESTAGMTAALETAHDHVRTPDEVVSVPGNGCSSLSAIMRVDGDSSPGANDRTVPRTRLARLATATDPPALFRPPRSI